MKITLADLEALIHETTYLSKGTLTICVLELTNGAQVVGQSNVIDPANFDQGLGEKYAKEKAIDKLWELEGYATKTRGAA